MAQTIQEILLGQAKAVKANSLKLAEAQRLEKQAQRLRAEASRPVKLDLKAIKQAKEARLNRFTKAFFSNELKTAEDLLTANGWQKEGPVTQQTGNVWTNPAKPGTKIEIKGSEYTVYKNGESVLVAPLSYLQDYLNK